MPKKAPPHINKKLSATLIFSGSVLILIAFVLIRIENIFGWIGSLLVILRPMLIGVVLTFVLYKPCLAINDALEKATKGKRFPCNGISVLLTYLLFLGIVAAIIGIIVPSFKSSIEDFVGKFSLYMLNIQSTLRSVLNFLQNSGILAMINLSTDDIMKEISGFASSLMVELPDMMENVGDWASGLTGILTDIVFGIAFSVYMLAGRTKLKSQIKRILKTFLPENVNNWISHYGNLTFATFSNFIGGQLMDALVLGILCFLGMTILGFPYAAMISVIIGVTNIIPIIGPIIGTVPGAIIYLMIDPWRAIWFVVFAIVIQQIDSNLIYPRVVGNSVGLPAIWILFAVTVGGGLFGVLGMFVGVPFMSIIYTMLREKTAAAAEAEPPADIPDDREPMFPVIEEKAGIVMEKAKGLASKGRTMLTERLSTAMHTVMEKLHLTPSADETADTEATVKIEVEAKTSSAPEDAPDDKTE